MNACLAFDDDEPAPHSITCACAGIAAHDDHAAAHPDRLAGERPADPFTGISGDCDCASFHARCSPRPGIPSYREPSALHQASNLDTNIACDIDFAFGHAGANAVEAFVAPLKLDLHCVAHADLEKLSRTQTHASRLQLEGGDLAFTEAEQAVWCKSRQIDALQGCLAQDEDQRAHGSRSLRW
jgi:hypothetical protein